MHKMKPSAFTAGTIERFVARDNAFSFMNSVKGTLAY